MRFVFILLYFFALAAQSAEPPAAPPLTFTGSWSGRWVDSRKNYAGNGGTFTCIAVENKSGGWSATFTVGKTRIFQAELQGRPLDNKIHFDTAASLGKFHGVYSFKGDVTHDTFTGEYSGPDEMGSIKMTRDHDPPGEAAKTGDR